MRAHPIPSKVMAHRHGRRCLARDPRETGYKRLVLKSGQDPASHAIHGAAKEEFELGHVLANVGQDHTRPKLVHVGQSLAELGQNLP